MKKGRRKIFLELEREGDMNFFIIYSAGNKNLKQVGANKYLIA